MSRSIHLISGNLPGYGPSDGRCFPCSGVSGRAANVSPCSSLNPYKSFSFVKIASSKCASRSSSSVCSANSGSYRRNPDFSRQNKHGFSRRRNRQNEERDGSENLEESELFSSKNGPGLSVSGTQKFQATATPGPREKEIVELFRKVQAQLRERAATKEEKKNEDMQGPSKQNETVDSLLKLLRKHSVQQGKRSNTSGSSRDFILDQPEQHGSFSEEKSTTYINSKDKVKQEVQESGAPSVGRPKSNFRRRSPVPQIKYQPSYSDDEITNSVSHINGKRVETISPEPELEHEPKHKIEIEPEGTPTFPHEGLFSEFSDDETSGTDDDEDDDPEDPNLIERIDLSAMKLPELKALAKSRGLKGFSKLKKSELVELLSGDSV